MINPGAPPLDGCHFAFLDAKQLANHVKAPLAKRKGQERGSAVSRHTQMAAGRGQGSCLRQMCVRDGGAQRFARAPNLANFDRSARRAAFLSAALETGAGLSGRSGFVSAVDAGVSSRSIPSGILWTFIA